MLVPADWQGSGDLITTHGAGFGIQDLWLQGLVLGVQGQACRVKSRSGDVAKSHGAGCRIQGAWLQGVVALPVSKAREP